MLRIILFTILTILGLMTPVWFFLVSSFVSTLLFENFWEIIVISIILNVVFVYNGANFQALYVALGVVLYVISWIIHTKTRLKPYFKKKES